MTLNNLAYAAASYNSNTSTTLTVGAAETLTWTTAPPGSATYSLTAYFTPVATSTSYCATHGGITYSVSGGACSINSSNNHVTMTSGGGLPPGSLTCTVTANLAACSHNGTYYGPATLSANVTPLLATPPALVLTGVPASAGDGVQFTVRATGGNPLSTAAEISTFERHGGLFDLRLTW